MARIRFLESRKNNSGQSFEVGKEYELPDADAARWVRDGRAVYAVAAPAARETKEIVSAPRFGRARKFGKD